MDNTQRKLHTEHLSTEIHPMKNALLEFKLALVFVVFFLGILITQPACAQHVCRMPETPTALKQYLMESHDAALNYPWHGARGGSRDIALNR